VPKLILAAEVHRFVPKLFRAEHRFPQRTTDRKLDIILFWGPYYESCQAQFKVLVVFPKMRLAQNTQMTPGMDLAETEDVLLAILMAIAVEDRVLSLKIPYIEVQSLNPTRW